MAKHVVLRCLHRSLLVHDHHASLIPNRDQFSTSDCVHAQLKLVEGARMSSLADLETCVRRLQQQLQHAWGFFHVDGASSAGPEPGGRDVASGAAVASARPPAAGEPRPQPRDEHGTGPSRATGMGPAADGGAPDNNTSQASRHAAREVCVALSCAIAALAILSVSSAAVAAVDAAGHAASQGPRADGHAERIPAEPVAHTGQLPSQASPLCRIHCAIRYLDVAIIVGRPDSECVMISRELLGVAVELVGCAVEVLHVRPHAALVNTTGDLYCDHAQSDDVRLAQQPSLLEFQRLYMPSEANGYIGRPVVIPGLAQDWPASSRWTDTAYWRAVAGSQWVPIEAGRGGYAHPDSQELLVRFDDLLEHHISLGLGHGVSDGSGNGGQHNRLAEGAPNEDSARSSAGHGGQTDAICPAAAAGHTADTDTDCHADGAGPVAKRARTVGTATGDIAHDHGHMDARLPSCCTGWAIPLKGRATQLVPVHDDAPQQAGVGTTSSNSGHDPDSNPGRPPHTALSPWCVSSIPGVLTVSSLDTPYLAQHDLLAQIPQLRADIAVPDYTCLLPVKREQAGSQASVARVDGDNDDDGSDGDGHADGPADGPADEMDDVRLNAWIGPAGTVSNLHYDPPHNLLVQLAGQKRVRLWPPYDTGANNSASSTPAASSIANAGGQPSTVCTASGAAGMRPRPGVSMYPCEPPMANTSRVDPEQGGDEAYRQRFPLFPWPEDEEASHTRTVGASGHTDRPQAQSQAEQYPHHVDIVLGPGETLYIPPRWWHHVRSLEPSVSVSFWWG